MISLVRAVTTAAGLLLAWQLFVWATGVAPYLLPGPDRVLSAVWLRGDVLVGHLAITALEIVLGMVIGTFLGVLAGLALAASGHARRWLLPLLIVSQALPVFALAPLLVLWLGYGIASKVAMTVLVIFFPVTAAFLDGLRRTDRGWLELAQVMQARPLAVLLRIRLPAALPALAAGLRVAAAVAPIGAVIGEWVGASRGLGFLMLQANARMQTDMMFAALLVLALLALCSWALVDRLLRRLVPWQPDTLVTS